MWTTLSRMKSVVILITNEVPLTQLFTLVLDGDIYQSMENLKGKLSQAAWDT